ncbi:Unknown protein [Striga hermonthica]|uniref:Uncharacterized protein n=1 Tax=Striga hermonthica TaxID=68872 RepID=A0A9N7N362_STRHE|nr:Unknown protein [Striga hermonthica]
MNSPQNPLNVGHHNAQNPHLPSVAHHEPSQEENMHPPNQPDLLKWKLKWKQPPQVEHPQELARGTRPQMPWDMIANFRLLLPFLIEPCYLPPVADSVVPSATISAAAVPFSVVAAATVAIPGGAHGLTKQKIVEIEEIWIIDVGEQRADGAVLPAGIGVGDCESGSRETEKGSRENSDRSRHEISSVRLPACLAYDVLPIGLHKAQTSTDDDRHGEQINRKSELARTANIKNWGGGGCSPAARYGGRHPSPYWWLRHCVEDKLRVSLPNSGFNAKPHIESRIKTLKIDFNIVYDMLNGPNTSGFDRATGGNAEGPNDIMEDIQREDVNLNADNDVEATSEIGLDDLDASFSPLQSPRSAAVDKRKKRKRSVDKLTAMTDIKEASIIGSEIAKASEIFGKAIGVDAEISEKRQRIDSEIRKIPNLAVVDVIKVVCRIAQSPELTDVFFSMTEEGREQLVMAIISGQV